MLVLSGSNAYSGATTVNAGTLQIGNGGSGEGLTSSIAMSNNATAAFNHADPLSYGGAISGSGQLIKLGTGVLDLSGTSSYSGPTTISAGTVELDGNGNNLPLATALTIASSGVLDLAGVPQTVGSLSGSAGAIITNHYSPAYASTLTVAPSSGSTTFAGNIITNVALALSGSGQLTLSGTNTYTGGTTVSGGTLDIAAPSAVVRQRIGDDRRRRAAGFGERRGHRRIARGLVAGEFGAVALSAAASAPPTLGGYESGSGDMATLGGDSPTVARRRGKRRRRRRRGRARAGDTCLVRDRRCRADRLSAAAAKADAGLGRSMWEVRSGLSGRRNGLCRRFESVFKSLRRPRCSTGSPGPSAKMAPARLARKIVNLFTKTATNGSGPTSTERQLVLAGGPAALRRTAGRSGRAN